MMGNFNFDFAEYLVIPIIIACCMIGFIIKNYTGLKNKYIPGVLMICGCILNSLVVLTSVDAITSNIVFNAILYGAMSGLASSGIYDFFIKALIHKSKEIEKEVEKELIDKLERDNGMKDEDEESSKE